MVQTHVVFATKILNTEDQDHVVERNDALVDSNGNDEIKEFSHRETANTHYDEVPAVRRFHDVGYLEFDKMTKLSI